MCCKRSIGFASIALAGLIALVATIGAGDPEKDAKPAAGGAMPEMKLPPGWTSEDMQACATAATPGKMHEYLSKHAGVWYGKVTMWMAPGMEPTTSEMTATYTPMFDGRFVKCEMAGDMPGMGPFTGMAIYGFDNVSQKFQSSWIDNCGTGMAVGTGALSADGKTLTWSYTYNCPIAKKLVTMREVMTSTSPTSEHLEVFSPDPKTGQEFKSMVIEFSKR